MEKVRLQQIYRSVTLIAAQTLIHLSANPPGAMLASVGCHSRRCPERTEFVACLCAFGNGIETSVRVSVSWWVTNKTPGGCGLARPDGNEVDHWDQSTESLWQTAHKYSNSAEIGFAKQETSRWWTRQANSTGYSLSRKRQFKVLLADAVKSWME